jgi:ferric-dicitrate binding protein FerR (iron transport regulator)
MDPGKTAEYTMKKHRAFYRIMLVMLALFTLIPGLVACGKSAPGLTSPTGTVNATAFTVLSIVGGNVLVLKPGENEWIDGTAGMTLGVDYKIKTGAGGHATITFFEGTTIELDSSTEITLDELDLDGTASHIGIEQSLGKTISRVKKLVDPASSYEIETPAAVASVRGTDFYTSVMSNGVTTVGSMEGTVFVTAQGVEVELTAGLRTTVSPGQAPGVPGPDVAERSQK